MGKLDNLSIDDLKELVDVATLAKVKKLVDEKLLKKEIEEAVEEEKKAKILVWVLAIIGVIAVAAGITYAVYRYLRPDYLDGFDDDFEDDFDDVDEDDFFVDEASDK